MRLILLSIIITASLGACQAISDQVERKFVEGNARLLDSIGIVSNSIDSLQLLVQRDTIFDDFTVALDLLEHFDSLTQYVIQIVVDSSDGLSDKQTPGRILVDLGYANLLYNQDTLVISEIHRLDNVYVLTVVRGHLESIEFENFNELHESFESMPLYVSVPVLNRWRLERLKARYALLLWLGR